MQVIPRTALLVARKHRYTKYRLSRLKRVDTNVIIGTTYLSDLAKRLGAKTRLHRRRLQRRPHPRPPLAQSLGPTP